MRKEAQSPEQPVSCVSPRWIFAAEPAVLEARRATAHLARSYDNWAHGDERASGPEVLKYLEAAQGVAEGLKQVLAQIVMEARHLGELSSEGDGDLCAP